MTEITGSQATTRIARGSYARLLAVDIKPRAFTIERRERLLEAVASHRRQLRDLARSQRGFKATRGQA